MTEKGLPEGDRTEVIHLRKRNNERREPALI